ncbi:MAG TPA: DUF2232 domain-containing protein [bacterium]|nr:DUF2232 domain-containing protein [bacterium]
MGIRGLTEGAILATLVALLALAARYLPVIQFAAALICPIPLTFLVIRQGIRVAVLAALVAAAVGAIAGGPLTGVAIVATFAPIGIALGLGVRNRWVPGRIVLVCTAVATASLLINFGLTLFIAGVNPYTVMFESLQQGQEQSLRLYERLGIDRKNLEQASGMMKQWLELMPRLIPLLIVGGAAFVALINFHVGRLVLRRFGIEVAALPPLSRWRTHALVLWTLPMGFLLSVLGQGRNPAVETAGLNLTLFAQTLLLLQGLLVAWSFFDRYGSPNWMRWIMIAIAFTQPILNLVIFVLGLADAVFDLRGRWRLAREART